VGPREDWEARVAMSVHTEQHCWHPFRLVQGVACVRLSATTTETEGSAPWSAEPHFCCKPGCKDVLILRPGKDLEVEEKSHGGVHPAILVMLPRPRPLT
jgi:hypothetical protein